MNFKIISMFLLILYSHYGTSDIAAQTDKKEKRLMKKTERENSNKLSASRDEQVKKIIVELDTQYQKAVKENDAATMNSILADDFVLVTGKGAILFKADLLEEARDGKTIYERQEDSDQTVRVWDDMAIITALLWAKGTGDGEPFEYKLWFSDVYKLTPNGWRYVFAQAAQKLPNQP